MYEIANEFKIAKKKKKKAYQRLEKLKRQGSILIGESVPRLTPQWVVPKPQRIQRG